MPQPSVLVPQAAWEKAETSEMEQVVELYGKVYHLWQVDKGHKIPLGEPKLMTSFSESFPGQRSPVSVYLAVAIEIGVVLLRKSQPRVSRCRISKRSWARGMPDLALTGEGRRRSEKPLRNQAFTLTPMPLGSRARAAQRCFGGALPATSPRDTMIMCSIEPQYETLSVFITVAISPESSRLPRMTFEIGWSLCSERYLRRVPATSIQPRYQSYQWCGSVVPQ